MNYEGLLKKKLLDYEGERYERMYGQHIDEVLHKAITDLEERKKRYLEESRKRIRHGTMVDHSHMFLIIYSDWVRDWFGTE